MASHGPGKLQLAKGVVTAGVNLLVGGFSSKATSEERSRVCSSCPHLKNDSCQICGCDTKYKAAIQLEKCPKGSW
jgi:Family of unknown function (DUF6171)